MPTTMPSGGNFFPELSCVENGVHRPARPADLEAVGACGSNGPGSIKGQHRDAKRAKARADVDGNPNGNPNPIRRITFD